MSEESLMASQIRQRFDSAGGCLSSNDDEHFLIIEDQENKSIIVTELADLTSGFEIGNPTQKDIYLLAVDNCLLKSSSKDKRCDCIIFDDRIFCFVELKLNVSKRRQATDRLGEAREQLGTTIRYFRKIFTDDNKDFLGLKLEAYAVMRQHIYPRDRASRKPVRVKFLDTYGVELFEENQKIFDEGIVGESS